MSISTYRALQSSHELRASRETAINLLPAKYFAYFSDLEPEVLGLTELELEEKFCRTPTDYSLRKRLWILVGECRDTGEKIDEVKWSSGICSSQYISQKLMLNKYRMAWLFTPLEPFQDTYENMFHQGLSKVSKFLSEREVNDDNLRDYLAFLRDFSSRVLGPIPRNINLKAAHLHSSMPGPGDRKSLEKIEDVDKRLKELETSKKAVVGIVEKDVIDVIDETEDEGS